MHPDITCLILAGGQGSRLFPLTQNRAKPAVRFGGGYRLIDIPISNALNSGIKEILIYTQYCPDKLNLHVRDSFPPARIYPARIKTLYPDTLENGEKEWYLGTADAIRKTKKYLQTLDTDYFLILSGDQLYTMDLSLMLEKAEQENADLVIATLGVNEEDASRFGVMRIDNNALITGFIEKAKDKALLKTFQLESQDKYLASMGIYLFKKEALFKLLGEEGDDFGKDLIPKLIKKQNTYAFVYEGYWEDIGTIPAFYQANMALIAQNNCLDTSDEKFPIFSTLHHLPSPIIRESRVYNSLISQGSVIEAKEVSSSVIGLNTHIEEGSIIENSIFLGGDLKKGGMKSTKVGKNCHIRNAIIDEHCIIGNNVKLTNKNNLSDFDSSGVYIRDGIMIVSEGTIIPDGYEL